MVCIYCGGITQVKNSRHQKRNNQIWRRRQCFKCLATFTTHESIDLASNLSVEINGAPRPFVADKLFTEVLLALQDRKDCYIAAREVTSTVVQKLLKLRGAPVFAASQISLLTAQVLKRLDRRAWLRYISEHPSLQAEARNLKL